MSKASDEKKAPRPGAGGFRHTDIGQWIREKNFEKASIFVAALLREHHTIAAVSRKIDVDRTTVERWVRRLVAAGHDPRSAAQQNAA